MLDVVEPVVSAVWVVVLCRAREGDDEAAGDVVGEAVHVVDLVRQQEFADVGEDRVEDYRPGWFGAGVGGGGYPARVEAPHDGDQLDPGVADVGVPVRVKGRWPRSSGRLRR